MLKGIVISLLLTSAWVLAHIIIFHIHRPRKMFLVLLSLFVLTIPIYPIIYLATPANLYILPSALSKTPLLLGIINGLFIHLLLFFTYVEFFYYVTRAVSLRILVEILNRGGKGVKLENVQKDYTVRTMILTRLDALEQIGFVLFSHGRYTNTAKGNRYARLFIFCRRFFRVPE